MSDSSGQMQDIPKQVPGKVQAIRFKKIIQTFVTTDFNGEEQGTYQFERNGMRKDNQHRRMQSSTLLRGRKL